MKAREDGCSRSADGAGEFRIVVTWMLFRASYTDCLLGIISEGSCLAEEKLCKRASN